MDPVLERRVSISARESHGFQLGRAFSAGRQGIVYHAEHIKSRREAVVKICYFSKDTKRIKFKEEVANTLLLQRSRYIAKVIHHHEDEKYGVMYLKKYETDLLEHLMDHPFTVESARKMFFRVCKGVLAAHQEGIAHRDLKPENVFLDKKGRPVVGDFGSSIRGEVGMKCHECIGTELYCAPEVLRGESYDPFACDVFSLGILLHVLVCGHWPYAGSSKSAIREHIKAGQLKMMESAFSPEGLKLIKSMTSYSASERPSMLQVVADEWFVDAPEDCPLVTPQHSIEETFPSIESDDSSHESDDDSLTDDFSGYGRFGSAVGHEHSSAALSSDRLGTVSLNGPKRRRSLSNSLQRIGLGSISRFARRKTDRSRRRRQDEVASKKSASSSSLAADASPASSPASSRDGQLGGSPKRSRSLHKSRAISNSVDSSPKRSKSSSKARKKTTRDAHEEKQKSD